MAKELTKTIRSETELHTASRWMFEMCKKALAAGPVIVRLGRESRTLAQNRKLWPMLNDLSEQVQWHGRKLTDYQWKDLLTGSFSGQEAIPMIGGNGFIFIGKGRSTSKMNKPEFAEFIEFIYSVGAEHGVQWSEPSLELYQQYKEAA